MKTKRSVTIEEDFWDEISRLKMTKSNSYFLENLARLGMIAFKASDFKDYRYIANKIRKTFE